MDQNIIKSHFPIPEAIFMRKNITLLIPKIPFFPYPNITVFCQEEENMKTLKKERERNQWKDLNKKHDVSSFGSIVCTQAKQKEKSRGDDSRKLRISWFPIDRKTSRTSTQEKLFSLFPGKKRHNLPLPPDLFRLCMYGMPRRK